jgi:hypothetical protein
MTDALLEMGKALWVAAFLVSAGLLTADAWTAWRSTRSNRG